MNILVVESEDSYFAGKFDEIVDRCEKFHWEKGNVCKPAFNRFPKKLESIKDNESEAQGYLDQLEIGESDVVVIALPSSFKDISKSQEIKNVVDMFTNKIGKKERIFIVLESKLPWDTSDLVPLNNFLEQEDFLLELLEKLFKELMEEWRRLNG